MNNTYLILFSTEIQRGLIQTKVCDRFLGYLSLPEKEQFSNLQMYVCMYVVCVLFAYIGLHQFRMF